MAYVVGLMATDGCLITGRKQLNFKSEDAQLVETLLACLGRPPSYRCVRTKLGRAVYVTQFSDARFYDWLLGTGLTPRKSLTLGAIKVPDDVLFACARGLLDGDGSILNFWYDGGGKASGRRYENLVTRFISASEPHIIWLRERLHHRLGVSGCVVSPSATHGCWALNFAIRESSLLLPRLHPRDDVPKLERKWHVWRAYAMRHGHPATLEQLNSAVSPPGTDGRAGRDSKGRFRTLSGPGVLFREARARYN
jgi:hypothetical protein